MRHVRGLNFGPIWGASGVQGFFGEGYAYHRLLRWLLPILFSFKGLTFVAKTTTYQARLGNMPLQESDGITPKKFKPGCIVVMFWLGVALNAVGLSGPGAAALFGKGLWQERMGTFFISFMSVATTPDKRFDEFRHFVNMLKAELPRFKGYPGLQINFSCPNVGLEIETLLSEVMTFLDLAMTLGIPIVLKFNTALPIELAKKICQHPACDGLCMSNTIPWKDFPENLRLRYFGTTTSPLEKLGGGGVSGAPLLPLVVDWVTQARAAGITTYINAGGGILHPRDVMALKAAGADSVFLGSAVFLRPWRVRAIIKTAHDLFF